MSILYDRVVNVVSKPPEERLDGEIEQILPWFRKKSDLFKELHTDIILDITKNCKYRVCKPDTVVIRQGEKGDCFYILLSGHVAIHINTTMTEDEFESIRLVQEAEERAFAESDDPERRLDRSKYGIYVGKIDAGKSFGELALINTDCVRNATIIADSNRTELLSVDRNIYNRSLRAFQAHEFEERKEFVRNFPLFHNWQTRYKKMMIYSLKKVTKNFQDTIVKQGAPLDGIHFILGGQVRIRVDPGQHSTQYPNLFPLGDIAEMEKEKARELLRKEMNLERSQRTDKRSTYQRRAVTVTSTKKENLKPLELCLARSIDTIGDIEMAMNLPTYSQTMECTEESTFYHLDQRNYDRLIEKRNPTALDMIRDIVHTKLTLHFSRLHDESIPLFRFFLYNLDEKERDARRLVNSARTKAQQQEIEANVENLQRGPLVNMYGPGSVFWLIRTRAKQMKVRKQRKAGHLSPAIRFGNQRSNTNFGFTAAASKAVLSNPGNVYSLGGQGQSNDPARASFVNLYGYQQGPTHMLNEDGDYIDEDQRQEYYSGEGEEDEYEDDIDGDVDDDDDAKDYATSDTALCQLEERMVKWHNSLGTNQKGTCVVRLHRYQFEDENRPKPGNKVYVKYRSKPRNVSFFALRNDEIDDDDDDSGDEFLKATTTSAQKSKNSNIRLLDIVSDRPTSDVISELQDQPGPPQAEDEAASTDRPQTSLGLQRLRSDSKGSNVILKKSKKQKQYTAAEYQALKAELRKRQKQWVSLMPQRSATFF